MLARHELFAAARSARGQDRLAGQALLSTHVPEVVAGEFLRNGGDPLRRQLLLGHEKLDMPRLYSEALSMHDALEPTRPSGQPSASGCSQTATERAVQAHKRLSPSDRLRLR